MIQIIHDFYFDDRSQELSIEFSTQEDGEDFFRIQTFPEQEILCLLPPRFSEYANWVDLLDGEVMKDALQTYYEEGNPLPPQQLL